MRHSLAGVHLSESGFGAQNAQDLEDTTEGVEEGDEENVLHRDDTEGVCADCTEGVNDPDDPDAQDDEDDEDLEVSR
jgi:hypothetical protein